MQSLVTKSNLLWAQRSAHVSLTDILVFLARCNLTDLKQVRYIYNFIHHHMIEKKKTIISRKTKLGGNFFLCKQRKRRSVEIHLPTGFGGLKPSGKNYSKLSSSGKSSPYDD